MVGKRICNNIWGWGEVLAETGTTVIVRFDQDPWGYHELPKEEVR